MRRVFFVFFLSLLSRSSKKNHFFSPLSKQKKIKGALKSLLARPDFSFLFDGMHGVAGPYAHAVFVDELGADAAKSLVNCTPKEDFGGG